MAVSCVAAFGAASTAHAQRRPRPEVRLDAVAARTSSLQAGVGFALRAGTYARLTLVGAAGRTLASPVRAVGRVDATARFVLDPFAESRFGLYGLGGVSVPFERGGSDPRLLIGAGVEGPTTRRATIAAELGLGGGLRFGLVVRGATRGQR